MMGPDARAAAFGISNGAPIACNKPVLIDAGMPEWCIGSLIFRKNTGLLDACDDVLMALQHVDCDRSVFLSIAEFEDHHNAG